MAVSFRKKAIDHLLTFAEQTVLPGPKYFLNRGTIERAVNATTDKNRRIEGQVRRLICIHFHHTNCFDFKNCHFLPKKHLIRHHLYIEKQITLHYGYDSKLLLLFG